MPFLHVFTISRVEAVHSVLDCESTHKELSSLATADWRDCSNVLSIRQDDSAANPWFEPILVLWCNLFPGWLKMEDILRVSVSIRNAIICILAGTKHKSSPHLLLSFVDAFCSHKSEIQTMTASKMFFSLPCIPTPLLSLVVCIRYMFYCVLHSSTTAATLWNLFRQFIVAGSKDDISTLKLYEHLLYDLRNWKSKSLYACLKFLIFH